MRSSSIKRHKNDRSTPYACSMVLAKWILLGIFVIFIVSQLRLISYKPADADNFIPIFGTAELSTPKNVWDEDITIAEERERCARYGYTYENRTTRRRIFMGALIADDSWDIIEAIAAEAYGIYHTACFIESNTTQSYFTRELRFTTDSSDLARLQGDNLFGPPTEVIVEFYFDSVNPDDNPKDGLIREHMQRDAIAPCWKRYGMRPDDLGVVMDVDETFTRDFLRALQICDVPEFRSGQDCNWPKILAGAMVFEGSPDCIVKDYALWRPDMVLGECVELIGNETIHKPAVRVFDKIHGRRAYGYGDGNGNVAMRYHNMPDTSMYPLLSTGDFRNYEGGFQKYMIGTYDWDSAKKTGQPIGVTGYHFHNFFENVATIKRKYLTFGHPVPNVFEKPLSQLTLELPATAHAIDCIMGQPNPLQINGKFEDIVGPKPIYFTGDYRNRRREHFRRMIEEDETQFLNATANATI